jgi:hypothetical protein
MYSGSHSSIPTNSGRAGTDEKRERLASFRSKIVVASLMPEGSKMLGSQNYAFGGMGAPPETCEKVLANA